MAEPPPKVSVGTRVKRGFRRTKNRLKDLLDIGPSSAPGSRPHSETQSTSSLIDVPLGGEPAPSQQGALLKPQSPEELMVLENIDSKATTETSNARDMVAKSHIDSQCLSDVELSHRETGFVKAIPIRSSEAEDTFALRPVREAEDVQQLEVSPAFVSSDDLRNEAKQSGPSILNPFLASPRLGSPRSSQDVRNAEPTELDLPPTYQAPLNSSRPRNDAHPTERQIQLFQGAHNLNIGSMNNTIVLQSHTTDLRTLSNELQPSHVADHQYHFEGAQRETLRREACTPGTRTRILRNIVDWAGGMLPESEDIYWLFGPAGSGKTTIAYTIARFLDTTSQADNTIILGGNFFCSRQFPETRSEARIIRTLAYQLARKCEGFADALNQLKNFDAIHQGVGAQMRDFLVVPWQQYQSTRPEEESGFLFLIDAVDELEQEGGPAFLRNLIEAVNASNLPGIKFFVTSRSNPEIVTLVETFKRKKLVRLQDVEQEEAQKDIATYLDAHLPHFKGFPEIAHLEEFAGTLFICAATVVRALTLRQLQPNDQLRLLRKLTSVKLKGATQFLDNLYMGVLSEAFSAFENEIDEGLFPEKLGILHAFLCTTERTSTSTVAQLLFSDEETTPTPSNAADDILSRLYAVLYLDGRNIVLSYHKSFTDFIFDKNRSGKFACDQSSQHRLLAEHCFHVMDTSLKFNIANIPSSFLLDSENQTLQSEVEQNISSGLSYACRNWSQHLSATPRPPSDTFPSTLSNFLQLQVLFWIETMNLLKCPGQCYFDLQQAAKWAGHNNSTLMQQLMDTSSFALYFSGSPASSSTPHLYISALATWPPDHGPAYAWRMHFPRIPDFKTFSSVHSAELMQINTGWSCWEFAVSADGTQIICGSESGRVHIYDAFTGRELKVLEGHTKEVWSVAISANGTHIISGSNDTSIRIWDGLTGKELQVLNGHTQAVMSVAISYDSMLIVSGSSDASVHIWDMLTGKNVKILEGHTATVWSVAISADGKHIISGSGDKSVRIWDVSIGAGLAVLKGHTGGVNSVAISGDGKYAVSGSHDKSVRIWEISTGRKLRVLVGHSGVVKSVAVSADGARIVSGSVDQSVRIWDVPTGKQLKVLEGHRNTVWAVAIFADGMRIASSSEDGSVKIWDGSVGKEVGAVGDLTNKAYPVTSHGSASADSGVLQSKGVEGHTKAVKSVAISTDGAYIISGSEDHSIRIWSTSTGEELRVLKGHGGTVYSVAISDDGKHIVSGSGDSSVRVWDTLTGEELRVLRGHTNWVRSVAISKDGVHIVSGSGDGTVRIWDTSTGENVKILKGHTNWVWSVAISVDGVYIVSGLRDNSVQIWDTSTGVELRALEGHTNKVNSVAISGDGTYIVSGSDDRTVRVWDTTIGKQLRVLTGHTSWVFSVAISTDGTRIVSGSAGNSVCICNASTGQVLNRLEGHGGAVHSVAFSADGQHVVSGSEDKTVRLWATKPSVAYTQELNQKTQPTGWIHSLDRANRLMFIPPGLGLPSPHLIRVFSPPDTQPLSVSFEQAALGNEWNQCYHSNPSPPPSNYPIL